MPAAAGARNETTGSSAPRSAWSRTTRALGQALRARGAHEVLLQHLEHARAREPRDVRRVGRGERERGQDQVAPAPEARDGQPAELEREDDDAAAAPITKLGSEMPTSASAHGRVVEPRARPERRDDAERDARADREREREEAEPEAHGDRRARGGRRRSGPGTLSEGPRLPSSTRRSHVHAEEVERAARARRTARAARPRPAALRRARRANGLPGARYMRHAWSRRRGARARAASQVSAAQHAERERSARPRAATASRDERAERGGRARRAPAAERRAQSARRARAQRARAAGRAPRPASPSTRAPTASGARHGADPHPAQRVEVLEVRAAACRPASTSSAWKPPTRGATRPLTT